MIVGIGTDIIEVDRVQKAIDRNGRFLTKVFTLNEIEYFETRNNPSTTIAGTFAVKEAVSKVFGTGIRGFAWTDMEVSRNAFGKPEIKLFGEAKKLADALGITEIMVSISHCETYAVAYCVGVHQPQKGDA